LDVLAVRLSFSDLFGVFSERPRTQDQLPLSQPEPEPQEEVVSKSVEFECKGTFRAEGYQLSDFRVVNLST